MYDCYKRRKGAIAQAGHDSCSVPYSNDLECRDDTPMLVILYQQNMLLDTACVELCSLEYLITMSKKLIVHISPWMKLSNGYFLTQPSD